MPVPEVSREEFQRLVVLPLDPPKVLLRQAQALRAERADPVALSALQVVCAMLESVDRKTSPLYERQIQAAARFALARAQADADAWAAALDLAQAVARSTQRPELAVILP